MQPKFAWIVHNNCRRGCSHCFCSSTSLDNAQSTEELASALNRLGIAYHVYAAHQLDKNLDALDSSIKNVPLIPGDETCGNLKELRPQINRIAFSLHGPDARTHELIAPKGDFDAILSDLKSLRSRNRDQDLQLFCVIHGKNYDLLEEICDFFRALGACEAYFLKLCYAGRSVNLSNDMFLDGEQTQRFFRTFYRIRNRFKPMRIALANNWGPYYSRFKQFFLMLYGRIRPGWFCTCGKENVTIKSDSREIYPCRYTITVRQLQMGRFDSIKGLDIKNSWMDGLSDGIKEPCSSCKLLRYCSGGCRAIAVTEKHRTEGIVDPHAGFTNCPVSLGAVRWIDAREDFVSLWRGIKKMPAAIRTYKRYR